MVEVKQGDVIYAILFSLYINNLIAEINLDLLKQSTFYCVYLKPSNDLKIANQICEDRKNKDKLGDHRIKLPVETLYERNGHYETWANYIMVTENLTEDQISQEIFNQYNNTSLELKLVS